jgi:hypothetical protein
LPQKFNSIEKVRAYPWSPSRWGIYLTKVFINNNIHLLPVYPQYFKCNLSSWT